MISSQELEAARACAGNSPVAQIEHAHIFGDSKQTTEEMVVFRSPAPKGPGKHYIKNAAFTTPPMT